MVLYIIGIGLDNEKDITLKGLEAVKSCKFVYLESYTSKLNCDIESLERLYGKRIVPVNRGLVENNSDEILEKAKQDNVAFLVAGDAFSATTHTDLKMQAISKKIPVKIIHNASILTAVGDSGLELYKFGKTTSIPFDNDNITTPYEVLGMNLKMGLHTLFLLDIDAENAKFMQVREALDYLLKTERNEKKGLVSTGTLCIGCGKVGAVDAKIKAGAVNHILQENFPGLQCLIIPGKLHFIEEEALKMIE